jgi:hypothetical protein
MAIITRIALLLSACLSLYSCSESPHIDFHSYQELCEYEFIQNGWFPELLSEDASGIQETYDVNNKHLYGKFDFKNRPNYDSIMNNYSSVAKDSLIGRIEKIRKPRCPKWFIPMKDLTNNNYIIAEHNNFYLIMDKKANRIYYVR